MREITYEDALYNTTTLTFDGRVVEVFILRSGSVARLHVSLLHIRVGELDRKERRRVMLSPSPQRVGGIELTVPDEAWPQVGPFLDVIQDALG